VGDIAFLFFVSAIIALVAIMANQKASQPDLPLVEVSVPQVNPQCAIPTLDYSKKPLRLDSKAIA
jgi:hypothetical protein